MPPQDRYSEAAQRATESAQYNDKILAVMEKKAQDWRIDPALCVELIVKARKNVSFSEEDKERLIDLVEARCFSQYRGICAAAKPEQKPKLRNKITDFLNKKCLTPEHAAMLLKALA